MNTILQIMSIVVMVLTIIGTITYLVYWFCSWQGNKDNRRWPSLYNREDTEKGIEVAAAKLRSWKPYTLFFILLFGCITTIFFTSRNLSHEACKQNQGVWAEWDSGFKWSCYNPALIQTENNLRIIHADEEN